MTAGAGLARRVTRSGTRTVVVLLVLSTAGTGEAQAEGPLARRRRHSDARPAQSQRRWPQIVRVGPREAVSSGLRETAREDAREEDLPCARLGQSSMGVGAGLHAMFRGHHQRHLVQLLWRQCVGPGGIVRSAVVVIVRRVPASPDATSAAS
jgi:hypothetical protein